jgi:hypothetical protein
VAEGARLESVYTLTGIGGSNPSLSAITFVIQHLQWAPTYTHTTSGGSPWRKVRVNLTKYIQTTAGPRYCPAVISPNGRIKQDVVLVNGKEERHPEGAYYCSAI